MKTVKLFVAVLALGATYASTVAFSPMSPQANWEATETKQILFETNDVAEVGRIKDLLSKEHMVKVEAQAKARLIKIKITVKGKGQGTEIDIQGGK